MNFFNVKTSWSNSELGLLKICVGSIYIIFGVYFHEFLKDYIVVFGILFFITALWTGSLWFKRMKAAYKNNK